MAVVAETRDEHRHAQARDLASLLVGAAALIFALAVTLYVLWKIFSSVQATGFDADGVRCFVKSDTMSCIKTAEPPR
jgi:hypothetical protein